MTWKPWRITKWQYKLVYVAAAFVIPFFVLGALGALGLSGGSLDVLNFATTLGTIFLGARVFRGANELVLPPRPWWQMTSRPKLSRRLGILFVALSALFVTYLIGLSLGGYPGRTRSAESIFSVISGVAQFAILAFFYLNSAVRLTRAPRPNPVPTQ